MKASEWKDKNLASYERMRERERGYYYKYKANRIRKRVQFYHDHQEQENAHVREYRKLNPSMTIKRRIELIELLGGKCVACSYSKDIRALCLDHINGEGRKERKKMISVHRYYKYYLENPEEARKKLQILCGNCNMVKMHIKREWDRAYNVTHLQ